MVRTEKSGVIPTQKRVAAGRTSQEPLADNRWAACRLEMARTDPLTPLVFQHAELLETGALPSPVTDF